MDSNNDNDKRISIISCFPTGDDRREVMSVASTQVSVGQASDEDILSSSWGSGGFAVTAHKFQMAWGRVWEVGEEEEIGSDEWR